MTTEKVIIIAAFFLLLLPIQALAEEKQLFFSMTLGYDSGDISRQQVKLIESIGEVNKKSTEGDYSLKLYSFNDQLLYETRFDFNLEIFSIPPKEWFDDEGNQIYIPNETETGVVSIEKTSTVVFAPYFRNANTVRVFKNNELKLDFDVAEYAVCNMNSICDEKESRDNCPEDCNQPQLTAELSFWQKILNFIKSVFT